MTSESLLRTSLQAAVPLNAMTLADRSWDELLEMARESSQIVAEKGDIILYRSSKAGEAGETAHAFNALARGIAILSFAPGGVTIFGDHYDYPGPQEKLEPHAAEKLRQMTLFTESDT